MGSGIYFPISAVAFSVIIIVLFFTKKSIKSIETRLYKYLLLSNFLGLVLELLCTLAAYISDTIPLLSDFILKSYLVYNIFWTLALTIYVYYISAKNDKLPEKMKRVSITAKIIFVVSLILVYLLRCDLIIENNFSVRYTTGPSVTFTYGLCAIFIFLMMIYIIKGNNKLSYRKYIPIYSFLVTIVIGIIIQMNFPGLLIMTYIETVTVTIMYFTIENPDIKILNELYKNKELMEQNYEDKYNFLFEITQEARNPLVRISSLCDEIKNEDDNEKLRLGVLAINNLVKQLDFSINNVLNISTLDVQNLKLIDSTYDLNKVCNDLVVRIKANVKENVEFKCSLPKTSSILYGDYMKLKQILYSLLINSAKYTSDGYIEFKVNVMEKYDICRIIFNITDSGSGMSIDEINEILSITGELNQQEIENLEKAEYNVKLCQKIIKIMGGSLMIRSDFGKGTEVKLVIDQRVHHDKHNSVLNYYENVINNYRKVLIVSQDTKLIKILKRKCNENNITYLSLLYGKDAIDRIKALKKYDFILISDEMRELSGLMTLKGMQEVEKFNTPTIVMLKDDKERIKNHYLDDGFQDYLLVSDIDNEFNRIIKKY